MISRLKKLVRGNQIQDEYENDNAEALQKIEDEAFKQEQKRRSNSKHRKEDEMRENAKQKAIESAKRRGARKATPITEQIEDNFDEAVEKATAAAKKAQEKALEGMKRAQDFIESPNVQKKLSNARHNIGHVGGDLRKIANPPRKPVRGRSKPVVKKTRVVEKVVREHPVHAKKEKPQVGNPNKGRFGVREDDFKTKPIIGNRNRGLAVLKSAGGDRDRSLFGRNKDIRFNVR